MQTFLWNILLALTWALMTRDVSLSGLVTGFILGYCTLLFIGDSKSRVSYTKRVRNLPVFALWFTKELLVSNLRVARAVLFGLDDSRPGMVAIPLDCNTELEITMLGNLITLTPGTLSVDVSDDRKTLYIHAMFIDSPDAVRTEIKDGLEKRLLEVMR